MADDDAAAAAFTHIITQFPHAAVRYVAAIDPDAFHLSASETGSSLLLHPSREELVKSALTHRAHLPSGAAGSGRG